MAYAVAVGRPLHSYNLISAIDAIIYTLGCSDPEYVKALSRDPQAVGERLEQEIARLVKAEQRDDCVLGVAP